VTEQREYEFKFSPGPLFRVPDVTRVQVGLRAEPSETVRLEATYYDTDDFRLARSGGSLRYREPEGWTVKVPIARDSALTRDEIHLEGDTAEPPQAALDLVRATVRGAPLHVVARLNTVRTRVVLRDHQDNKFGEIADDEVSVLQDERLLARFRELEVEFDESAPPKLVDAIVNCLSAAGAGPPDPVPKIVRALGPRAAEPPDVVPPVHLDVASPAIDVIQAAVASGTARLLANDPGVRLGTDPESVHQARVATRRLRSDLRTFRSVLDEEWSESLRAELKWLGGLLGAVRDTEVLLDRLERRLSELPASDADDGKQLLDSLAERRELERRELLDAMRSDRYVALLDRLVDASRAPRIAHDAVDSDIELAQFVRQPWRKLRKAVEALESEPADHELHRVRILTKRCRYAAEAVASARGKGPTRFAKAVARLQDVLGEHQDAIVAGQWLREHSAAAGFVAGELAALERDAARTARAHWPKVWKRARRPKLRRWM
jgi:CHAD domain-containing protein